MYLNHICSRCEKTWESEAVPSDTEICRNCEEYERMDSAVPLFMVESEIGKSAMKLANDQRFMRSFVRYFDRANVGDSFQDKRDGMGGFQRYCEHVSDALLVVAMWYANPDCTKICKCGGEYELGLDEWASRVRCLKCDDWYDLSGQPTPPPR